MLRRIALFACVSLSCSCFCGRPERRPGVVRRSSDRGASRGHCASRSTLISKSVSVASSCSYPPARSRSTPVRRGAVGKSENTRRSTGVFWWAQQGSNLRRGVYKTPALPLSYGPWERAKSRSHEFPSDDGPISSEATIWALGEAQIRRIAMSASCAPRTAYAHVRLARFSAPPGAASDLGLVGMFFIWDCDARFPTRHPNSNFWGCVPWDACRCAPSLFATSSVSEGEGMGKRALVLSRDAAERKAGAGRPAPRIR